MYEREQDMMKNESNNTAASEPKQPESTVTNQNPYSTSAATGGTAANHTAETNRTASGTTYGAANRYGSTTPTGYGYTTNSSTNQSTGYTGNTSSDTQSQQQGYSYVNYYSNPNAPVQASGSGKPPKKKNHFWMKAVAFVAAMAIVSVGSIGIYNGVHNSNKLVTAESSTSASDSTDTTANTTTQDSSSKAQSTTVKGDAAKSWIELASGTNAMSISDIVKKVAPSVVGVQATFKMPNNYNYNYGFGMFGNGNSGNGDNSGSMTGVGTGIIMREDGYIVTNAHVLQNSDTFWVTLNDSDEAISADCIGMDTKTDLAVLKINRTGLPAATIGDSDSLLVGEEVVAIGNPAGLTGTVTNGIVSALHRKIKSASTGFEMDCIQTNAAISPGNSGGALVNLYGQIVGITSSKYTNAYSGSAYEGLGFAISINAAMPILEELTSQGYVSGRVRIGITFRSLDITEVQEEFHETYQLSDRTQVSGLWISEIAEDCDISNTELQVGDVIERVNGTETADYDQLNAVLSDCKAGDSLTADCCRYDENGKRSSFTITFQLMEDRSGNF